MKKIKFNKLSYLTVDIQNIILNYLNPYDKINFILITKESYSNFKKYKPKFLEIIFLIDTTRSMDEFVNDNIHNFTKFFNDLFISNVVRFSIIYFRDYSDFEYTIKKINNSFISNKYLYNIKNLTDFIKEITCDGGSDVPEAIEAAFDEALLLNYHKNYKTHLFLFTDSYPHLLDIETDTEDSSDEFDLEEYVSIYKKEYIHWLDHYINLEKNINNFYLIDCSNTSTRNFYFLKFIDKFLTIYNSDTIAKNNYLKKYINCKNWYTDVLNHL